MLLYRRTLLTYTVILFYGNIVLWAFAAGKSPLPPLPFVVVLFIATLPLLAFADDHTLVATPLLWWFVLYGGVIVGWFLWTQPTTDSFQILRTRFVGILFVLTVLVNLAVGQISTEARRLVCALVVIGVGLNIYEFFHLGTFSNVLGRAAGFYVNPNISGSSLLAGMTVGVGVVPSRWRAGFVLFALLGVALTISRGALLCAGVVLTVLSAKRLVSARSLLLTFAVLFVTALAVIGITNQLDKVESAYELTSTQWLRLGIGSGPLAEGDELSNSLRREVAEKSWTAFLQRPFTGEGTGMTGDTTHNMYLMFAAEHGIIGLLLFPLLPLSLLATPRARKSPETLAFASFLLLWGLFSHNVLEEFPLLFCIALASQPLADPHRHSAALPAAGSV